MTFWQENIKSQKPKYKFSVGTHKSVRQVWSFHFKLMIVLPWDESGIAQKGDPNSDDSLSGLVLASCDKKKNLLNSDLFSHIREVHIWTVQVWRFHEVKESGYFSVLLCHP